MSISARDARYHMRITPNHPRLRSVALSCWIVGAWLMMHGTIATSNPLSTALLEINTNLLALFILATGIVFWELSTDRRAGIVFDSKGLLLNLGHSSAFVAWSNIERIGICQERATLLALGSRQQLGISLSDPAAYIQSY